MRISDWSSDVCSSDLFVQPRFAPVGPGEDRAVLLRAEHRLAMLFRIEALAVEIADVAIVERAAAPLSEHELVGGRLEFGEQPLQRLIGCMLAIFAHSS